MPNGYHYSEQEWHDVTSFFETISAPLNEFAATFGLVIDKYYHNAADWTFRFAHPLGGHGQIQLMRIENNSIWIAMGWYVDDYDSFTRSTKHEVWKDVSIEATQLSESLEKALKTVLRWKLGEWNQVAGGFKSSWARYTREDFKRMGSIYPVPVVRKVSKHQRAT